MSDIYLFSDSVLDALDSAPLVWITGEVNYVGPGATVQQLAAWLGKSDSAIRSVIHQLRERGLVRVFDALDPVAHRRRLFIVGEAEMTPVGQALKSAAQSRADAERVTLSDVVRDLLTEWSVA